MNILVCIKQVPDTTIIKIDPETNTLMREGVPAIVSPFDAYAGLDVQQNGMNTPFRDELLVDARGRGWQAKAIHRAVLPQLHVR